MKDQILHSTKNIVKYINANTDELICVFSNFTKKHLNKSDESAGKHILNKLIKSLTHIETYILEEKWNDICKLEERLVLSYRTMKYIYENIKLQGKDKKIIKNLLVYLYCVIKLIKNKLLFSKS